MGENLVIVESPAKAKTIEKILGKNYVVKSSFGHIRDLSKKKLGIDIENDFTPVYEISTEKKKVVAELKDASSQASTVWLASDEDREGEAIAWHLQETLNLDPSKTKRIVFHEITKDAILNAIEQPRMVDMNLVMAQQARRVLDRIVGFEISPILWKRVKPSLSAGRVQSVALRLVVEREREIAEFKSKEYYRVEGIFSKGKSKVKGVYDEKFETLQQAQEFLEKCRISEFEVVSVDKRDAIRTPAPPFTTSSLQQEASRKCGFSVSQTMTIAQHLYEAGLITYMRTDSTNLSKLAIGAAKEWINNNFGPEYHKARQYKTGVKGAQEAHEAIRPTYIANADIQGSASERELYSLIWKRTVASQMADARLEKTDIHIKGDKITGKFVVTGSTVIFDGFLKLYIESKDDEPENQSEDVLLPVINVGDGMDVVEITATEKYTAHPPRYSEASLVKKMEELGIGRPSTYAPTITTLHHRDYIQKRDKKGEQHTINVVTLKGDKITSTLKKESVGAEKGRLSPGDIGVLVTDFLLEHFPSVMDYGFTAKVEQDFDKIAAGKMVWNKTISSFYKSFHALVEEASEDNTHIKARRILGVDPATGKQVIVRMGRFGSIVQLGEDDDKDKKYASLDKGQLIETITLEEALQLISLPRVLGEYDGNEVICAKGKFGPYIKYGSSYVSLKRGFSPYTVTLDQAVDMIKESELKQVKKDIKSFPEHDIEILNGRYGPYLKHAGENYKLPKTAVPEDLTLQDCLKIIEGGPVSKKSKSSPRKKK
ncbi:MAG: type I DNA topoisomerase [Bacteroidales bacterium]|nr:type I DNA topoisomerase [Bacteroidales bacterium]